MPYLPLCSFRSESWRKGFRPGLVGLFAIALIWSCSTFAAHAGEVLFKPYRAQTGIVGIPFHGPKAPLAKSLSNVSYSLVKGPNNLTIDEKTGAPSWMSPSKGRFVIRVKATVGDDSDILEWILCIVSKLADDVTVYSTQHIDFVVTKRQIEGNTFLKRHQLIDSEWESYAALAGQEPINDRQIFFWQPGISGSFAGSPVTFGDSPNPDIIPRARDWDRWGYNHELAHNFNFLIRTPGKWSDVKEDEGFGTTWLDKYIHHLVTLNGNVVWRGVFADPRSYGLSQKEGVEMKAFITHGQFGVEELRRQANGFKKRFNNGTPMEKGADQHNNIFSLILGDIADKHGTSALIDAYRLMRYDVLPKEVFDDANTTMRKWTLLLSLLSAGAKQDIRPLFAEYGLRVEEEYYQKVFPQVQAGIKNLPPKGEWDNGWINSPFNGKQYRVMRWKTDWDQATRTAKQWGGRLLEIHSEQEQQWLTKRFVHLSPVWLGLRDEEKSGDWSWVSGHKLTYVNWNPNDKPGSNNNPGLAAIMGLADPAGCWRKRRVDTENVLNVIVERDK